MHFRKASRASSALNSTSRPLKKMRESAAGETALSSPKSVDQIIWRVPFFNTKFGDDEAEAVLRPLKAGWLTMGEEVLQLESELQEASGARHAIAVTNCTAALHLAAVALGVGPGDEV